MNALFSDTNLSEYGHKITIEAAEYITEALLHEINQNHDEDEHVFAKIMMVIYDISPKNYHINIRNSFLEDVEEIVISESYLELYS